MSRPSEGLPTEVTVGEVFSALYDRADTEVQALDAIRGRAKEVGMSPSVPGTALVTDFNATSGRDGSWFSHRTIGVEYHTKRIGELVSIGWHETADRTTVRPTNVQATRRNEPNGDYSLSNPEPGLIECRLGARGLWRTGVKTKEPVGMSDIQADQKVGDLAPVHKARLEIVTRRIVECLTAIELLKFGADAHEALALIGRPLEYTS